MKKNHVLIMGAGVVGVTSAWYLRQQGFDVTVVDRQPQAGLETSKANGGQISVSHAEPWANPSAPVKLAKWLLDRNAPLKFRPAFDASQWQWCLQFLRECHPERTRDNIKKLVNLGMYSRMQLAQLREELGLNYQQASRGILHFYTNAADFEAAKPAAEYMTSLGCERQVLSAHDALTIEPALQSISGMVGATYTAADESGNAFVFTQQLAAQCRAAGVNFLFDTAIEDISVKNNAIDGIQVTHQGERTPLHADHYVLSLGSYSTLLAKRIGLTLLVHPAKGYSVTFPVTQPERMPYTSLTDDEHKLVFSRFQTDKQDVLRVAGMAEIQGGKQKYNTEIYPQRAELITQRVQSLFPSGLDYSAPRYWTGLRPTTPSNVPYIGSTPYTNLYLNTGHGTLGWTHSCGSAKVLADLLSGKKPAIDWCR